jgi:acetyl esterase/lipase
MRYLRLVQPSQRETMKIFSLLATLSLGATLMSQAAFGAPDAAADPRIDPEIRTFLAKINKDSSPFWELPQPKPQQILTDLQRQTAVDMSGIVVTEQTFSQDGRTVKLYIMKPEQMSGKPGVLLFIHGGVWLVGNFENHQRLLRDLVVGSGQIGVFVEYTSLPEAKFPTQIEQCYAALKWVSDHAQQLGADGSRIAVAGNSVGGNMTAALSLMSKDRTGPKISYQVLLIPATDASVDSRSYHEYGTSRFLTRAFMKYGWDLYAPDAKTRDNPYVSPLRANLDQLKGLPPALVITAENDPLRDEGEAYARKLKEAGVRVDAVRFNGTIHDFVALNALRHVPSTEAAIDQINDGLRQHLDPATH